MKPTLVLLLAASLAAGCGEPSAPAPTAALPAPSAASGTSGPAPRKVVPPPEGGLPVLDSCGNLADSNDRCAPLTELSGELPGDVCVPDALGWEPNSASVEHLAWRTLVALLWPARAEAPDQPDPAKVVGARTAGLADRTVLEGWKTPEDLVALAGENGELAEDSWSQTPPLPGSCRGAPGTLVLRHPGKVRAVTAAALASDDPALEAFGGPVIDQNGHVVFVDTRINRTAWEVVASGGFQRPDRSTRGLQFPNSHGDTRFGVGAMTVQTAWVELNDADVADTTLLVRDAVLYQLGDEEHPAVCDPAKVGLVAVAIGHKAGAGDAHWVWSVFESDAAGRTDGLGGDESRQYMFASEGCADPGGAVCEGQVPGEVSAEARCCPNLDLHGPLGEGERLLETRRPTELARVESWQDRSSCTEVYRTALADTPLGHLLLVGSQYWENLEAETPRYGAEPRVLRSMLLQPWMVERGSDGLLDATASCIACHAGGDDGTFFLRSVRGRAVSPDAPDASPSEAPSAPE